MNFNQMSLRQGNRNETSTQYHYYYMLGALKCNSFTFIFFINLSPLRLWIPLLALLTKHWPIRKPVLCRRGCHYGHQITLTNQRAPGVTKTSYRFLSFQQHQNEAVQREFHDCVFTEIEMKMHKTFCVI